MTPPTPTPTPTTPRRRRRRRRRRTCAGRPMLRCGEQAHHCRWSLSARESGASCRVTPGDCCEDLCEWMTVASKQARKKRPREHGKGKGKGEGYSPRLAFWVRSKDQGPLGQSDGSRRRSPQGTWRPGNTREILISPPSSNHDHEAETQK